MEGEGIVEEEGELGNKGLLDGRSINKEGRLGIGEKLGNGDIGGKSYGIMI